MQIKVIGRNGSASFRAEGNETLLEAALRSGVDVPYNCASGSCGICKAHIISGEVTKLWQDAPGYGTKQKVGDALLCQCAAKESIEADDLVLSLSGAIAQNSAPATRPERIPATIVRTDVLGEGMLEVELELDRPIRYVAGQFGLFYFPGIVGGRAFSFAAPPTAESRSIVLVVKRKPEGPATTRLFAPDLIGSRVEMFGPLGHTTFEPHRDGHLLCVVGGSGVSLALAIMGAAVAAGHFRTHRGTLIIGIRHAGDLTDLAPFVEMVKASGGGLRVVVALSDNLDNLPPDWAPAQIAVETGFAHEVMRKVMEGEYTGHVAYVAGPPPMVQAVQRILVLEGKLPGQDIRSDTFY